MIANKTVTCALDGTTASSNRPVGICYVDGQDIGAALVAGGYARDCARFSRGRYAGAERAAQRAGLNLAAIYDLPRYCR